MGPGEPERSREELKQLLIRRYPSLEVCHIFLDAVLNSYENGTLEQDYYHPKYPQKKSDDTLYDEVAVPTGNSEEQ